MLTPRERSRPTTFFAFLFLACLLLCAIASAAPSITLSKKSGPPTSKILVSGRGFEPNVGVDIFFDTKDKALVVTNGKGEFSDARIHAPRTARPGEHWVTALERNNDKGAQAPFLVRTNWSQFHFSPDHEGVNPYENVLTQKNVLRLNSKWTSGLDQGAVFSTPVVANGIAYITAIGLYAVDAETGVRLWTFESGSSTFLGSQQCATACYTSPRRTATSMLSTPLRARSCGDTLELRTPEAHRLQLQMERCTTVAIRPFTR